jgi:hypothetical protein
MRLAQWNSVCYATKFNDQGRDRPSIVSGPRVFPGDLLPDDPDGYRIQVMFVSEDFTTGVQRAGADRHIATALLWLLSKSGQSYPIVNGKQADKPGPVALRLRTPWIYGRI